MNAVQSENSVLSRGISRILPVYGKINSVLTQNNREFKKNELRKKSIFQQLGTKIAKFADIRRNNNAVTHTHKNAHFKAISRKKSRILLIFDEMVAYSRKKSYI